MASNLPLGLVEYQVSMSDLSDFDASEEPVRTSAGEASPDDSEQQSGFTIERYLAYLYDTPGGVVSESQRLEAQKSGASAISDLLGLRSDVFCIEYGRPTWYRFEELYPGVALESSKLYPEAVQAFDTWSKKEAYIRACNEAEHNGFNPDSCIRTSHVTALGDWCIDDSELAFLESERRRLLFDSLPEHRLEPNAPKLGQRVSRKRKRPGSNMPRQANEYYHYVIYFVKGKHTRSIQEQVNTLTNLLKRLKDYFVKESKKKDSWAILVSHYFNNSNQSAKFATKTIRIVDGAEFIPAALAEESPGDFVPHVHAAFCLTSRNEHFGPVGVITKWRKEFNLSELEIRASSELVRCLTGLRSYLYQGYGRVVYAERGASNATGGKLCVRETSDVVENGHDVSGCSYHPTGEFENLDGKTGAVHL